MISSRTSSSSPRHADRALTALAGLLALLSGFVAVGVFVFIAWEAIPGLRRLGPRLLTDPDWLPDPDPAIGTFNAGPLIVGSVLVTIGAMILAAPIGVLMAVFATEFAPRTVAGLLRRMLELLAGVPSVVFGLVGLTVLVPLLARVRPPGANVLAGSVVLALMIVPTVALLTERALRDCPIELRRASAAIGLSRWTTVRRVLWPVARGGVVAALVLAVGRAIGETMAVLMVCGNVVQLPGGPFDPVRTLTANIALEMGYARGVHQEALFATGFLLLLVTAGLVLLARRGGFGADA